MKFPRDLLNKKSIMKLIFFFLASSLSVCAQNSLEVYYNIQFDRDFKDSSRSYLNHNGILKINSGKSSFEMIPLERYVPKSENHFTIEEDAYFKVQTDIKNRFLLSEEFYFGKGRTWVIDSLYPMQWKIDTAQKKVGNYTCIRATCFFRGRNYVAWFTPEIPLSLGPWKMGGLPGLIVELEDSERYFIVGLKKISNGSSPIELPKAKYDWRKFYTDQIRFLSDLNGSMNSKNSDDCLTCEATSKFSYTLWETL